MKIGHGSNSGIQGFRNLGIEGILSLFNLLILSVNPSIPQFLNPSIHFKDTSKLSSGQRQEMYFIFQGG